MSGYHPYIPTLDQNSAEAAQLDRIADAMIAARRNRGIRPDSERKIAVLGGSFDPPHFGHLAVVEDLEKRGFEPWVVTSMGHVYKLHTTGSFHMRNRLAKAAFRARVRDLELDMWERVGQPIYTWDLLTEVRRRVGPVPKIFAAIGADIDPKLWQGYPEIIRDGFEFEPMKEVGSIRSTQIRAMIQAGEPRRVWGQFVPDEVADLIERHYLYTGKVPPRPDLTYLA